MLTIHFVGEGEAEPLCRRPERREWMWAADPTAVTCASCVERMHEPPPEQPSPDREEQRRN